MRRLSLFLALFLTANLAFASEDGVWTTPSAPGYFFIFQEESNQLLMVVLAPYTDAGSGWQAFFGPYNATTRQAPLSTLASPLNFQGIVTFADDNNATLVVSFCVSRTEAACLFSAGQNISFSKVF